MLEPRKTRGITDYRPFILIFMLTSFMLTTGQHSEASLISDQSYLVSPTPTLPVLGADDVTTVLLVNNTAHKGRFLTVRPEIGLLTSTVRTFIQDGITTEFATKVVGTKLNNGRFYAQYLKKSSRVFYDNEHLLAPSVVTSWVGDGGETLSLQSHNELFNMDDVVDWQDIDDNLGVHRGEFVGNTDFVGIQTTTDLDPVDETMSSVQVEVNKPFTNNNIKATSEELIHRNGITKLTDNLQTFTVNNNIRRFKETTKTIQDKFSTIQQQRIGKNVETPGSKRVLASVTYYGFADFTTIVGDSVIVFSPSTMQSSLHFGHVTSIKGKPTLNPETDFLLNAVPKATSTQKISVETSVNNISSEEDEHKVGDISVEGVPGKFSLGEGASSTFSLSESAASTFSLGESVTSSFSLEDGIAGTFSLKEGVSSILSTHDIIAEMPTEILSTQTESKFIPSDSKPDKIFNQINRGATTVFLDDDPFTNFLELKTDEISNSSVEITRKEMLETITNTVVYNDSIIDLPINKSSQDNSNDSSCDHSHLTSQVFLTQMSKSSSIQVGVDTNPIFGFDIVETTKYYCIQAAKTDEAVNEVSSDTVVLIDTSTESTHEELMSTELIDDLDETTARNFGDYDVTTEAEGDDDYDGNSEEIDLIYKTLYTTYTYLTTFFEGSQSTVSSHTEIITNIISSTLELEETKLESIEHTLKEQDINSLSLATKYTIPLDIVKVLNSETEITKQSITNLNINDIRYTKTLLTTYTYYTSIFADNDTEIMSRTEVITNFVTDNNTLSSIESNSTHNNSSVDLVDPQIVEEDQIESSSFIKKTPLDDQVSSESNDNDEIMPSATLLLQTSYTTFTFYTTMYVGDDTNIISRLETVTNVATETLPPTKLLSVEDPSFPITYFTTFTYWTKLAKDGEITTLSREETLFNVIQPTNNRTEILSPYEVSIEKTESDSIIPSSSTSTDITTYYTTYTYYTTSYEANSTIIASSLETVTNVVTSSLSTSAEIEPSFSVTPSEEQIILSTRSPNVILYDYKHIIDADEISTLYFTTEVVSSMNIEGSNIEVTSSTSRLHVDEAKKSILSTPDDGHFGSSSSKLYKTGLVRLIEGKRIQNNTTTLYESKVIGTIIDNRYAQIIESTSSFLYEKVKTDEVIAPTSVQNLLNEAETRTIESTNSLLENVDQDVTRGDIPQRPFAPVIRPFASRNRPTYAPKQKTLSPSSATIITRSDITPTITATPALKSSSGGRYSSSRRGIISNAPINPSESNLSQTSRRLFGRPSKSLSNSIDQSINQASFQPSRNRFASSSRSNLIASSSRRPNISFRSSIAPGFRASGINNNPKLRVKPTSLESTVTIQAQSKKVSSSDQISSDDEGNITEEISGDDEEQQQTKRNQNPLLRFRRPINRPSGFSPITKQSSGVSPGVSLRKNPLLSARTKSSPTTSTTTSTSTPRPKSRNFQRPAGLQIRSRPQNSLFPPRGLFQSQKEIDTLEPKSNEGLTDNDSEYDDSSEDDEDGNHQKVQTQKRSTKLRVRRQVDPLSRSRFRFRRQNVTAISPNLKEEEDLDESTIIPRGKTSSRFGSRFHTPDTTTAIINHKSIRPTRPTSKRPQFTLREKDVPTSKGTPTGRSNFRRQPTSGNTSLRRTNTNTGTSNNRRLKSYGNFGNNKNTVDNGRSSINTSRSRNTNTNNALSRGRGGSRGRNRNDYSPDLPAIDQETQPITVTHFLPAEVMIPVINGHVTEYKNIVTAKTSIEVVALNQLTQFAGSNGLTSLYLNREESSINNAGITEHTKYLLHESITSTIIFTPTTIRGRKTSFSHILPSTAYSVEYVVTTVQPQISANAPLANILLSQLLLGNLNLPGHAIIQQPSAIPAIVPTSVEPVTEYRTHTSSYVTTIFDGKSTILPVTFQGKKILTTVYDTSAEIITATEYSVETIINTAPIIQSQMQQQSVQQVNNLLLQQLLLQQQQQEAQAISKTLSPQIFLSNNLQDLDDATRSILNEDFADLSIQTEAEQSSKSQRKKSRKSGGGHNRRHKQSHNMELLEQQEPVQQSVVTLYISGRRPGEFSTVLSTVNGYDHSASLHKRQAYLSIHVTNANQFHPEKTQLSRDPIEIIPNEDSSTELTRRTTSLESIVGDVDRWLSQSTRQSMVPENKTTKNPGCINNTSTTIS